MASPAITAPASLVPLVHCSPAPRPAHPCSMTGLKNATRSRPRLMTSSPSSCQCMSTSRTASVASCLPPSSSRPSAACASASHTNPPWPPPSSPWLSWATRPPCSASLLRSLHRWSSGLMVLFVVLHSFPRLPHRRLPQAPRTHLALWSLAGPPHGLTWCHRVLVALGSGGLLGLQDRHFGARGSGRAPADPWVTGRPSVARVVVLCDPSDPLQVLLHAHLCAALGGCGWHGPALLNAA